jgi:hypothetical protein
MISSLHLQIIIDLAFFVTIILLLHQLTRKLKQKPPAVDEAIVGELRHIMAESQEYANHFLESVEENRLAMGRLVRQLEAKEKELMLLMNEAARLSKNTDSRQSRSETVLPVERYDELLKMIQQGLSREEAAKISGLTEGEISLVIELAKTRTGQG